MRKKILTIVTLFTTLLIVLSASGCSKKSNTTNLPTAKSLISKGFNKGLTNGHFSNSISSKQMKESSTLNGYFKGNSLVNMDYSLTAKGKTQNESIWFTSNTAYFLLKDNKGKWIKTSPTANNFDPDQVTNRFLPSSFESLNKSIEKGALVKQNSNNYTVNYEGASQDVWKSLNNLIVDTLNTPGTQNMEIVRMINAGQPKTINLTYIFDKQTKKLTKMVIKTDFTINGQYEFNWKLNYDELGQHRDLSIPNNIQKDAVDVNKQSK